ncbi:CDP-glycerol glycerophosphotransferase family protein, partial [Campylobacter coli]|nr:CDP-glycerol glycerophosphotransferase family protein [Campylobacter coli]
QMHQVKNLKLSGYSKMDSLNNKNQLSKKTQPIIILAPHHTVQKDFALKLSNFLRFSDFYLKLPTIYPNVHFIFRPHPLLFINLENNKIWSKEQIKNYIHTLTNYANVSYENGGDYFESFIRSDALIHDCGSFIAEYLYLDKPECFIFQNKQQIDHEFTNNGKKVLEHLYMAQTEKDIIDFIDNIVIKNMDFLKEKRIQFAKENIRFNHPYATQCIMDFIKMELTK